MGGCQTNDNGRDLKPADFFRAGGDLSFDFDALVAESNARVSASIASESIPILTVAELAKLEEIRYLHDTALRRALARDGHSKSSEGAISINLGTYWSRLDDDGNATERPEVGVEIYSYNLGPHRSHWFASIDRALETVRVWYAREMTSPETIDWNFADDADI